MKLLEIDYLKTVVFNASILVFVQTGDCTRVNGPSGHVLFHILYYPAVHLPIPHMH